MRIPSFIKVPRNRRFELEPRYYDPVKEDMAERVTRIRREMNGTENPSETYLPGRITFERKTKAMPNSSFLQLLIAAILGLMLVGWLYFGNQIFYLLWLVVPFYLFFRIKRAARIKR